jgi:uncharacterized membrane protein YeaQ/YmgE (transglycosylase-associated protein family)
VSRGLAIFIFWVLGFTIGSVGYMVVPGVASWLGAMLPNVVINQAVLGSVLAGVVGSAVSTIMVVTWANRSE